MVIDWTAVVAGPLTTRLLADLGARVIRIEQVAVAPSVPRAVRATSTPENPEPWNWDSGFRTFNRGKLSLPLDVQHPAGKGLLHALVAKADGLVTNFSARVLPNAGLTRERMQELNPALVCLAVTGYGTTGPYADRVAFGPMIECESGLSSLGGYPDYPTVTKNVFADASTGVFAAAAFVAALLEAKRTGKGTFIDLSMLEVASTLVGPALMAARAEEFSQPAILVANEQSGVEVNLTLPTSDHEWVAATVPTEKEWRALATVQGFERFESDPRFRTPSLRARHYAALCYELCRAAANFPARQLAFALRTAGIPAEVVAYGDQVLDASHGAVGADFWVRSQSPQGQEVPDVGSAFRLDGKRHVSAAPAPAYGEHTRNILKEVCGLSDIEVDRLVADGATSEARAADRT
jgi:crotonobetainyl-CoA:carnitine CoA-transferase CaiB-like acyl-CoA transferase